MALSPRNGARAPVLAKEGCGVDESNRYWLNMEPCGVVCACVTWSIVLFCTYAFVVRGFAVQPLPVRFPLTLHRVADVTCAVFPWV